MTNPARNPIEDLRGVSRLAVAATRGITALVEAMQVTIASGPAVLGQPLAGPARIATRPTYGIIRGVTRLIGGGVDRTLALLAPLIGTAAPGVEHEAVLAALNGVLGDYLDEHGNPLAIEMQLRHAGVALALTPEALRTTLPRAGAKVVVLIHGSCMNDLQWNRRGHDHGAALARELGYTPIYVHYNTGLHVSINGRMLATLVEQLVTAWPVAIDDLALIGHSMGGLVARSACHAADQASHAWRRQLRSLITLGTPHHGAPLERGGSWVDVLLGLSRYSAPLVRLGQIRSAGVTDLRYGNVRDEDWQGLDRFADRGDRRHPLALPAGVACYAIAATLATSGNERSPGDGLVPVPSALGRHASPALTLAFPDAHRWIAPATGHNDLLDAAAVYAKLRSWLAATEA
jgi:pimeloyl-ACP methyl ester carboxylesterase